MFKFSKQLWLLSLTVLGSTAVFYYPIAANAAEKRGIEEVVVTAQRVKESIQDVPIAVTALTGEMLEDKGVLTASDLQMSTPSLSFTPTNFGGSSISIRGIGQLVTDGESGVSTHVNEIALSSNLNSIEFFDMERVEVLRGPQGTLFGRNATGGAVNFVTRRPDFDGIDGFLDIEAGDYDNIRVKGAVNFPITDNFAVRLAGMSLDRDGYIENLAHGQLADNGVGAGVDTIAGIDSDIDGRDITAIRATAEWSITDKTNLWVMYTNFDEDDDRARITNQICVTNPVPTLGCTPEGFGFDNPNAVANIAGLIFGVIVGAYPIADATPSKYNRRQSGFREVHTDFEPLFKEEEEIYAFGLNIDLDQYTLGLTGAYQEREFLAQQDYWMNVGALLFDGSVNFPISAPAGDAGDDFRSGPCNLNDGTSGTLTVNGLNGPCSRPIDGSVLFSYDQADDHREYWTLEGKIASSYDGPFNFLLGASAYEDESNSDYYVFENALPVTGLYPAFFNAADDPADPELADGWAVFGEAYYDITDDLKFTVGLRYNEDTREKHGTSVLINSFDLNGPLALNGALGGTTFVRTGLADFIFGAPLGNQTDLATLYGVDAATIAAAENTAPVSPERIGIATTIPSTPQSGETRALTNSPTTLDFDEYSGRIGFDWQVGDNSMVYGFVSRGYKPGGLNPAIPPAFQDSSKFSFDSEEITAYELGTKNTLLDGTMVLNGAIFFYDYSGLQVSRIKNNSAINDNIDADIFGLETELFWRPDAIPNLEINAAYSYMHTEVGDSSSIDPTNRTADNPDWIVLNNLDQDGTIGINFIAQDPAAVLAAVAFCAPLGGVVPLPDQSYPDGTPALWSRTCIEAAGVTTSDGLNTNLEGNELPNTPDHSVSLGAAYTWDIPAIAGALTLRWDYYWQGDSFAREFNTKGDEIDSWDQHNASLIYQTTNDTWSGRLFVRNLADKDNVTGHYLTSDTSGFFRNYFLTEPRIYGLSVRYNFAKN